MEEKVFLHNGSYRAVSYCSKTCKRKDWGEHKVSCLAIQELSERNYVYNGLDSETMPVYPTKRTPKDQTKIANLIAQKCKMLCRINGVEIKVLLDTGAKVSIISYQDVKSNFPDLKIRQTEELLESGVDVELTTGIGTKLLYLGWVEMSIELKGHSKKSNRVIAPLVICNAAV